MCMVNNKIILAYLENKLLHLPWGSDMLAPSMIACAREWSPVSRAYAAAFSASQISFLPSNAGAVSQNSSRLDRNWPSVKGTSLFHFGFSGFRGWFLPIETKWTYTGIICQYMYIHYCLTIIIFFNSYSIVVKL